MGNLLAYSGLTTKVKAMQSRLLTSSQLQELASLDSVTACVEYLKSQPAYETVLGGAESGELHRSVIEQYLKLSEYRDFDRLYRFSNLSQRKFLDFYFMHYEVAFLKRCLRSIIGHSPLDFDYLCFSSFLTADPLWIFLKYRKPNPCLNLQPPWKDLYFILSYPA